MKKLLLLASLCLTFACASTRESHVPLPQQNVTISSPLVARIYVLDAPVLSQGLIHQVLVEEDDRQIGTLDIGNYACWEREPGNCLISVTFKEMEPVTAGDVVELVDTTVQAGQVYYYGVTIDPLWKRPKVRVLQPEEARAILANLSPVQPITP